MPPAPLRTSVADLALRAAVERGDLASVRRIASGPSSNPDCVSRYDGTTPFWIACCQGYLDIAKFLDQHCAVDKSLPSFTRQTPLSVACAQGHLAIVRYLVRHPQFDYRDLDLADVLGRTPFWYACDRGHLDIARFLHTTARYRFNPNHADSRGETVLHRACLNYCRDTSVTVDFLLNECVNVINVNKPTISSRWTPLHIACDTASIQLVRRLLNYGWCKCHGRRLQREYPASPSGTIGLHRCGRRIGGTWIPTRRLQRPMYPGLFDKDKQTRASGEHVLSPAAES